MIATLAAATIAAMPVPSMERLLPALSWAESRDSDAAVGKSGEISRFQILEGTWRQVSAWRVVYGYTGYDLRDCQDVKAATVIAQDYLTMLSIRFFAQYQRDPTLLELLCGWNRGPPAMKRRPSKTTRQLYERVVKRLKEIE